MISLPKETWDNILGFMFSAPEFRRRQRMLQNWGQELTALQLIGAQLSMSITERAHHHPGISHISIHTLRTAKERLPTQWQTVQHLSQTQRTGASKQLLPKGLRQSWATIISGGMAATRGEHDGIDAMFIPWQQVEAFTGSPWNKDWYCAVRTMHTNLLQIRELAAFSACHRVTAAVVRAQYQTLQPVTIMRVVGYEHTIYDPSIACSKEAPLLPHTPLPLDLPKWIAELTPDKHAFALQWDVLTAKILVPKGVWHTSVGCARHREYRGSGTVPLLSGMRPIVEARS